MVDVFISYPRAARAKVEPIRAKLEALGLEVFFDIHGIDGGDTFPDVIDRALKSAKAVLGVWSPRAFQSKWCMIECRVGATRGVLVPVALERFSELDMKSDFMTTNYLDLTDFDGGDSHEGWARTMRALSHHVGRDLGGTPAATPQHTLPNSVPLIVPEMVRIPAGRFLMGSPPSEPERYNHEGPQHEVHIKDAFELGKYPVTFEEWDAALAAGAELLRPDCVGGRDRHPVANVNWHDAKAYVAWLNATLGLSECDNAYRLPSEAEWEYACRAGTTTRWSFGDDETQLAARAWFWDSAGGATKPVGQKEPNRWGLFDMHGNVEEWCEDAWHDNYDGAPNDGSAWIAGGLAPSRGLFKPVRDSDPAAPRARVVRGGGYIDEAKKLRSAYRNELAPTVSVRWLGFRVARSVLG